MKELTELIGRKTTKAEKLTAPNPIFASDVRSAGMLAFFKPTMPVDSITNAPIQTTLHLDNMI